MVKNSQIYRSSDFTTTRTSNYTINFVNNDPFIFGNLIANIA